MAQLSWLIFKVKERAKEVMCGLRNRVKTLPFHWCLILKRVAPSEAFVISKIVSLAICKYLESVVEEDVFIKWPNDIYVGEKKICGILIENQFKGNNFEYAIIGIGLNVNQTNFQNLPRVTSLIP